MKTLLEKVSYLKGLSDGLKIDDKNGQGKIITEIINVLEEMAEEVDDISAYQDIMDDQLEAVDEDLAELEDYIYDLDLDDFDYDLDYDDDYDDYDSLDFPLGEDESDEEYDEAEEDFSEEDED